MSKYLSRKIKFISLFAMIGVVFLHSYNFADRFLTPATRISEGFKLSAMFEYFVSNGLCRFAVPMFFMISGFLFFFKYENSIKGYKSKIAKRSYSLLTPYLLWAFISAIAILILTFFNVTAKLDIVTEHPVTQTVDFLYCFVNPPAFQLWYLQQLIIFTVISPLIYLLIKYTKGIILIPFCILWLLDLSFIINSQALFFYSAGAAIAIFDKSKSFAIYNSRRNTVVFALFWILLSALFTVLAASAPKDFAYSVIMTGICKVNEIVGIIAMWLIFDHIIKRIANKKVLLLMTGHLFFIYALHEPLLHIAYQVALFDLESSFGHVILFICLPISVIAFCIIVSMAVRKLFRPIHKLLTGGRS